MSAKIGILVVAYNAASTLERVLDRIPADFRALLTDPWVSFGRGALVGGCRG